MDADDAHLKKKSEPRRFEVAGLGPRVFCAWEPKVRRLDQGEPEALSPGSYAFLVRVGLSSGGAPIENTGVVAVPFTITEGVELAAADAQTLADGHVGHTADGRLFVRPEHLLRFTPAGGRHVWAATLRVFHDGAYEDVALEYGHDDALREKTVAGYRLRLEQVDASAMTVSFRITADAAP